MNFIYVAEREGGETYRVMLNESRQMRVTTLLSFGPDAFNLKYRHTDGTFILLE